MRQNRRRITALLVAATLLPACITDPVTGKSVFGIPTSLEEESAQGFGYKPYIVAEFGGRYPDAELEAYLGGIVLGMAEKSVRPELPWSFTVLNTSIPNAFAIPGGQVFMTRGLLWRMEDEAEFAVVMGHEIGHVEHRHAARSQMKNLLTVLVASGVGELAPDEPMVGQLAQAAGGLLVLSYSRDQERESDARGVTNSYALGYDPREGADVFRTFKQLKEEGGGGGSALDAWLSSHPLDDERIASISQLAAQTDPRLTGTEPVPGLTVSTERWAGFLTRLRAQQAVYERYDAASAAALEAAKADDKAGLQKALTVIADCESRLPGHATFSASKGWVLMQLGQMDRAKEALRRAAALDQGILEPEYYLGVIALADGAHAEAIQHADRGLAILPDNYLCLFIRAEALWERGDRTAAEEDYRAVLENAPEGSEQHSRATERAGLQPAAAPGS